MAVPDVDSSKATAGFDFALAMSAVEASADAVIGLTREGVIEAWSDGAERLYGYAAGEARGQSIAIVHPESADDEIALCAAAAAGRRVEVARRHVRRDALPVDVAVTVFPVKAAGSVIAVGYVAREVSVHDAAAPAGGERSGRGSERAWAELERVARLAGLGVWDWNPGSGEVRWSAMMYEIFGRDRALGPAIGDALLACVCAEDRARVEAAFAHTADSGAGFALDYSIVAGDGVVRVVHAVVDRDPGRPGWCVGSVQDVSEQRRAHRELVEASARAEAANRSKSEFVARISHALRTPLNTIVGFGQLLELEPLGLRERGHVAFVSKAARQLLDTVNAVVELSSIQSGEITISPQPVGMVDAVRYAIALVAPLARERDVRMVLGTDLVTMEGRVQADPDRLHRVLLSVLSNAIQYNRPGGRVDVSCALTDMRRVRTAITDTGIGIAPDRLGELFEPFARLGAEGSEVEGAGLGLALAKGLIEAMGGTIEVKSQPGSGTTVVFELAAVEPSEAAPVAVDLPEVGGTGDHDRRRIIYIEDNLANLTLVTRILEEHSGVELVPAMQAAIGLELAREHHPDLIVLDLHLPDMPGTEALERLRAEHPEIPVVVLTADARPDQEQLVRELGAADYLTKPLDVQRFLRILAAHLPARPGDGP